MVSSTARLQILRCLPAGEIRLHGLRQRLALAFYLDDIECASKPAKHSLDLQQLTAQLDENYFKITTKTNYPELGARMAILDYAIDDGMSSDLDLTTPGVEEKFNKNVDALATRIKVLWSSISDAAATQLSRIVAKEVMDGVYHRLMFSVRTKPQPKKSVFDLDDDEEEMQVEAQSAFMKKFFTKRNI